MNELTPSYFFDLSNFSHASLFDEKRYVWEALSKIKKYLSSFSLGKIEIKIPQGTYLIDPHLISIGKGSVVEPGAYIKGPCIIGENCTVRHGAYIRGDVITGNGCVIGHDTEIKGAILLNEAHAAHFAYVGDSILGNKVNLGAGVKCANLKLTEGSVSLRYKDKKIDTGLRKFGAIIGDRSKVGCNTVTNPGTLLGKDVKCYACINFGEFIPSNSIVKCNSKIVII